MCRIGRNRRPVRSICGHGARLRIFLWLPGGRRRPVDAQALPQHRSRQRPAGRPDAVLDKELADDAIHWLHNQKANGPNKPFFIYYVSRLDACAAPGAKDWIAKSRASSTAAGISSAKIHSPNRRRPASFSRRGAQPSARATSGLGFAFAHGKSGRCALHGGLCRRAGLSGCPIRPILDELQRMGQIDNTLIVFIEGDNGASGEGTPKGTLNEIGMLANKVDFDPPLASAGRSISWAARIATSLYPAGWAWALDTAVPVDEAGRLAFGWNAQRHGGVVAQPYSGQGRGPHPVRPCRGHRADPAGGRRRSRADDSERCGAAAGGRRQPALFFRRCCGGGKAHDAIFRDDRAIAASIRTDGWPTPCPAACRGAPIRRRATPTRTIQWNSMT